MADYSNVAEVKDYLGGAWAGSDRDAILGKLVTRCSRSFDRETGKATNYWAAQTGVTRRYAGSGDTSLDIDEFAAITSVTVASNQAGTEFQTLSPSDKTGAHYVQILPLHGPPYNQLYYGSGFLPDAYRVGNVVVTGTTALPEEITHAVTIWAAYSYKSREAGWADAAQRPDGPGLLYVKGIPPQTKRIIDYYRQGKGHGPGIALVSGGYQGPLSLWQGWRAY